MITLHAPAKINLYLNILGERSDGYHEIESVFHAISLCDNVSLEVSDSLQVFLTSDEVDQDDNSALQAYHALARFMMYRGVRLEPVRIAIEKRIPVRAGLGGGSSDAAAVLCGLNKLFGLELAREELARVAIDVGSDVPFFLYGGACLVSGRGERIMPLQGKLEGRVIVAIPSVRIDTAFAYALWDRKGKPANRSVASLVAALRNGDWEAVTRQLYNSFLEVLEQEIDEIRAFNTTLRETGLPYGLSGSGSAFFILARDESDVEKAIKAIDGVADEVYEAFPVESGAEDFVQCT
jgi:4-diphosphocytidyl-2-C-methyl-D-erythritol kinase